VSITWEAGENCMLLNCHFTLTSDLIVDINHKLTDRPNEHWCSKAEVYFKLWGMKPKRRNGESTIMKSIVNTWCGTQMMSFNPTDY
jgi:hypothetical protein